MMCTLLFLLCRLHEPAPGLQDNWYGKGMGAGAKKLEFASVFLCFLIQKGQSEGEVSGV